MERFGDFTGDQISVNIIGLTGFADAHRGDDRDEFVLVQGVDNQWINADDLPDHADVDDLRRFTVFRDFDVHLAREDQAAVLTAQPHRHAAMLINEVDDRLVNLTDQDHLDNIQGLLVRDSHAANKAAGDPHLIEHFVDLRAAAMDHDGINTYVLEKNNVLGKAVLQFLIDHGIAAIFDDERLAVEAPDVGQRFHQHFRLADKTFHHRSFD